MTPQLLAESYKLLDLANDLAEANALAERCSNENVELRLRLNTAEAEIKRLRDGLLSVKCFLGMTHGCVLDMTRQGRKLIDEFLYPEEV